MFIVKVLSYVDVLKGKAEVGRRVAVIGAGGIGFDVSEYLLGEKALQTPAEERLDDVPSFLKVSVLTTYDARLDKCSAGVGVPGWRLPAAPPLLGCVQSWYSTVTTIPENTCSRSAPPRSNESRPLLSLAVCFALLSFAPLCVRSGRSTTACRTEEGLPST